MSDFQEKLKALDRTRKYDDETLKEEVDRLRNLAYQRRAESLLESMEKRILLEKAEGEAYNEGFYDVCNNAGYVTLTAEEEAKMKEAEEFIPSYLERMKALRYLDTLQTILFDRDFEQVYTVYERGLIFKHKKSYSRRFVCLTEGAKVMLTQLRELARADGIELSMYYEEEDREGVRRERTAVHGNWDLNFLFPRTDSGITILVLHYRVCST